MQANVDELKRQAEAFLEQGKENKARARYQKIVALGKRKRDAQPREIFDAYLKLGEIHESQRKWRRAMSTFARALQIAEQQIGVISPESELVLGKLSSLSRELGEIQFFRRMKYIVGWENVQRDRTYWQDKFLKNPHMEASRDYFERKQAIQVLLQAPCDYPDNVAILFTRARIAIQERRESQGADLCRLAEQECARLLGATHPRTLDMHAMWTAFTAEACFMRANQNLDDTTAMAEAERAIAEIQQIKERIGRVSRNELFATLTSIGYCYARHKRYDEAWRFFEEELTIAEAVEPPDTDDLTRALCDLAQCAYYLRRYDEAEQFDQRVLAIREKLFSEDLETVEILHHLVKIYEKQGHKQDLIEQTRERLKHTKATGILNRCYRF